VVVLISLAFQQLVAVSSRETRGIR
jgi:hypothetical protein